VSLPNSNKLLVGLFGYLKNLLAIGWCQETLFTVNFKELKWELSVSAAANPVHVGNLVSAQLSNEVAGSKLRSAGGLIEKKYN
jgi:hypothetical protein